MRLMCCVGMLISALSVCAADEPFPAELVSFTPFGHNPVFTSGGPGQWDAFIRERGWILKEDGLYHLWYTGYAAPGSHAKHLGYATSSDGITWTRHDGNPLCPHRWVEDMMVVKEGDTYHMFAEGRHDRVHRLTSKNRIDWTDQGVLDVRMKNGKPIAKGPFGTPAVLRENGRWYLFYERKDEAIWLAASDDLKTWTNVQDEPVILRGPEAYDRTMIAVNQVVKHGGRYYAYYHATCPENGKDRWTMNVAASDDLVHWTKYAGNPIIPADFSSGILVDTGNGFRFYCMHRTVSLFVPKTP